MNLPAILNSDVCVRMMLVLGHFLWQATVIALAALVTAWALRRSAANARYLVLLAALVAMAACPPATFLLVGGAPKPLIASLPPSLPGEPVPVAPLSAPPAAAPAVAGAVPAQAEPAVGIDLPQPSATVEPPKVSAPPWAGWEKVAPHVTLVYLAGVGLMLIRLLVGLHGGGQLRQTSQPIVASDLLATLSRQARRIGLRLTPAAAWCRRVVTPTVVGIFRPVILLPAALMGGLTAEQIEGILLHELAHIRRHDYLVNLVQRVIEAYLFFHPAVWWVSRRIRAERENCCDDMAVAVGGRPASYAALLLDLAEKSLALPARQRGHLVALGAADRPGGLRQRVHRLMGISSHEGLRLRRSWPLALVATVTVGLAIVLGCLGGRAASDARQAGIARVDYESWVSVAAVGGTDRKTQRQVESVLKANAIDCLLEGSVVYGVRVPPKDKDRATTILKADATQKGYWIEFADGTRPPRKVDLQAKAQWEKALAAVKRGMDREQLIAQLKLVGVNGGSGESQNQAGEIMSGRYMLDADWQLDVEFAAGQKIKAAKIEPTIHFGSGNLLDLHEEIPDKLYGLVEVVNQAPQVRGFVFDPAPLIRVVNTLHAAGHDRAIEVLETYLRLCDKDYQRNWQYGLDEQKLFFIMRLLFVRKDGNAQMPEMLMGAGDVAPPSDKAAWPLFPLAVESDVPFMLVRDYGLRGEATPASKHLEYVRAKCRLREKPMSPGLSPVQAVQKLTASANFKALLRGDKQADVALRPSEAWTIANLRRQALRAVSHLHPFPVADPYYLDPDPHGRQSNENEAKWLADVNALEKLRVRWDPVQMAFQAANVVPADAQSAPAAPAAPMEKLLPGSKIKDLRPYLWGGEILALAEAAEEPLPETLDGTMRLVAAQEFKVVEFLGHSKVDPPLRVTYVFDGTTEAAVPKGRRVLWVAGRARDAGKFMVHWGLQALEDTPENRRSAVQAVAAATAAAGKADGAAWGEAVEGVQARLRAEKREWQAGETPTFKAAFNVNVLSTVGTFRRHTHASIPGPGRIQAAD